MQKKCREEHTHDVRDMMYEVDDHLTFKIIFAFVRVCPARIQLQRPHTRLNSLYPSHLKRGSCCRLTMAWLGVSRPDRRL